MSSWNYVIGAYAVAWIAFIGYATYLYRRGGRAGSRMEER